MTRTEISKGFEFYSEGNLCVVVDHGSTPYNAFVEEHYDAGLCRYKLISLFNIGKHLKEDDGKNHEVVWKEEV